MDGVKLDSLEYDALVNFLAMAKDRKPLVEVADRFELHYTERLRAALNKILAALPEPTREEKLSMESFALIESLTRQQINIEYCSGKYSEMWWRLDRIKWKAHSRYERRQVILKEVSDVEP